MESNGSSADEGQGPFTVRGAARRIPSRWRGLFHGTVPAIDRALGLTQLQAIYKRIKSTHRPFQSAASFLEAVHEEMRISPQVREESLRRVPRSGPLIVVANHPYGGIEATILLTVLSRIRPDVRFMANFMLGSLPETQDFCIYVDPFGGEQSARSNLQPLRESIEWVQKGGVLCIFPSGTVSHLHVKGMTVTDPAWSVTAGRIIRKTAAPVLPIFFPGRNNWLFQAAGVIHPMLRTVLLPRQFLNKQRSEIKLKIGNLISFEKLNSFASDADLITYLRLRTYILGYQQKSPHTVVMKTADPARLGLRRADLKKMERIAPPSDPALLLQEVERLPSHQRLADSGEMSVYYARSKQIPAILRELGRLREKSFREVNEGTGKSVDLDHFDAYYIHLFVWHHQNAELVGAYRLAKTDKILRHFGKSGLYTSTLFDYRTPLLQQMGPAIELGRSFVRSEYQRNYTSLLLLWRGICQYVLRYPRYRILFGPVSINNEYDTISRELIMLFLRANNFLPDLARLIKARNPMSKTKLLGMDIQTNNFVVKDVNDINDLLRDMEAQQRSIPILLKQYLKLGGKILGFNIDSNFGDVLDGLIFVDLLETDPKLLERYMGKEGTVHFRALHGRGEAAKAVGE